MGDHSVDRKMLEAKKARDKFQADERLSEAVIVALKKARGQDKKRLLAWRLFFSRYQIPEKARDLREKIAKLETKVQKRQAGREEGYVDPKTSKYVKASSSKMSFLIRTSGNTRLRKACFDAQQKLALQNLNEYVEIVRLRNAFARMLGYEDFYAYKVENEEGMSKRELFEIFDTVYEKTKFAFGSVRKIEKKKPGLRKPWNYSYMLSGDLTKEIDSYFQMGDALIRWGRSFCALGVSFHGSTLVLDLVERKGKYSNGFCHWPEPIRYKGTKRIPGRAHFTANTVPGQVGSGTVATDTLFHEAGHAAHYLNSGQTEVCLNTEFPPASTAWAEVQSMFMDTLYGSVEWAMRYAKDKQGDLYPMKLFKKKLRRLYRLRPLGLMGIMSVANFERDVYEENNLSAKKVVQIAKKIHKKFSDMSVLSLGILNVPHIYSWESACSYHAYGLAELAVFQWRKYFYKKYGYIVDNAMVGKEMLKVWKLASSKTFKELVKIATGKYPSPRAYIEAVAMSYGDILKRAEKRIRRMKKVREYNKPVDLDANIKLVHGSKLIADNKNGFEKMAEKYKVWLLGMANAKNK